MEALRWIGRSLSKCHGWQANLLPVPVWRQTVVNYGHVTTGCCKTAINAAMLSSTWGNMTGGQGGTVGTSDWGHKSPFWVCCNTELSLSCKARTTCTLLGSFPLTRIVRFKDGGRSWLPSKNVQAGPKCFWQLSLFVAIVGGNYTDAKKLKSWKKKSESDHPFSDVPTGIKGRSWRELQLLWAFESSVWVGKGATGFFLISGRNPGIPLCDSLSDIWRVVLLVPLISLHKFPFLLLWPSSRTRLN